MSARNLYRGLFELLTAPQGEAASEALLATGRAPRRELLSVARQEDCLPELYALWNAQELLSPTESAEHELFARRKASVADVRRALPRGSLLAEASALRGGTESLVVLLPDFAALGSLHEALVSIGYRLDGAGEWRVPSRDPVRHGVASLRYAMSIHAASAVRVDVQVAGVPIDARRNLAFSEFAPQATRPDGCTCRVLEPTRQLLHRVAAFGTRPEPVTVRDIAELHLLLRNPAHRVDATWLHGKIEQLDAWIGLRRLREAIAARRLGAVLPWGEFGRLVEISASRVDTVATPRARIPPVGAIVKAAFGWLPGPRNDDIAARLARAPWLVSRVSDAGFRVFGVPVSGKVSAAPRLLRVDGALYLATGAGLMLLSLVDLGEGARARLAERVRRANRPIVLARWTAARPARGTRTS
jgi:hypothetical protein